MFLLTQWFLPLSGAWSSGNIQSFNRFIELCRNDSSCFLTRVIHGTSKQLSGFVTLLCALFFLNHFVYLSYNTFDYSYNMRVNILTGVLVRTSMLNIQPLTKLWNFSFRAELAGSSGAWHRSRGTFMSGRCCSLWPSLSVQWCLKCTTFHPFYGSSMPTHSGISHQLPSRSYSTSLLPKATWLFDINSKLFQIHHRRLSAITTRSDFQRRQEETVVSRTRRGSLVKF